MNESEHRLTQELDRAASTKQVDVDQLWQAFNERTADSPRSAPVAHPRRWRRRLTPYLAAASVASVFVVAALFADGNKPSALTTTPDPVIPTSRPSSGPLPSTIGAWACQYRRVIEPGINSVTGNRVRAVLDSTEAPPEAIAYGVPRYQFTLDGTTVVLDYGDSSGRRIARTELTLHDDRLAGRPPHNVLGAGGTAVAGSAPPWVADYTSSPLPLDAKSAQVKATPPIGDPILLDDRTYYDATGMLRHRTLYTFAVEGGYQFASMPADGSLPKRCGDRRHHRGRRPVTTRGHQRHLHLRRQRPRRPRPHVPHQAEGRGRPYLTRCRNRGDRHIPAVPRSRTVARSTRSSPRPPAKAEP